MDNTEQIKVLEGRIQKLEGELEITKSWQMSEMTNYVKRQDEYSKEFRVLYHMVQGEGKHPGLFEEVRNLKKVIKVYGIMLTVIVAGSELGIFKEILQVLVK